MVRCMLVLIVIVFNAAGTAFAQSDPRPVRSFVELRSRVSVDDVVTVVDTSAHETRGRITMFSDTALTLAIDHARLRFTDQEVERIERRRRDSSMDGLLIGAGAGAVIGYGVGRRVDSPSCPRSGVECGQGATLGVVTGVLWGASIGWFADTLIHRREVVYVRP